MDSVAAKIGCGAFSDFVMMPAMPSSLYIQAWRLSRGQSLPALAGKTGLSIESLESIEAGESDPSAATLDTLAAALAVPTPWLFADPKHFDLLRAEEDGDPTECALAETVDPIAERIFLATRQDRTLYVLLTSLIQSGDPKLLRAAEVSLRSLVKQSRQATVPWQSRPPGHFEPPSD
jgi:transcriptional regulator with XRE-family HTH domain